ncbi:MAG TPA: hypothetical protein VGD52_25085 [Pseudoduganella sp.]
MGLVLVAGALSGAAWLFGSVLPAMYVDLAFYADHGPMLDLGLLILLSSLLFGAAGALLTVRAGRRLPKAPHIHLLASTVCVILTAVFTDGPFALLEVLFAAKFWAFMFGTALVFFVAHRRRVFQPTVAGTP